MYEKFKGTGTAMVTPFHKDGSIDFKAFENLIEYQIRNRIDYLVFMGTTGEAVTLTRDEQSAIIQMAVECIDGRIPLVIGIGGNNTRGIESTLRHTDFTGVDAVLSVSPYYNKPQQKGIFHHYQSVAGLCPVPVIIYNVPARTGSNIQAGTTLRIAREIPNVIGVKEASHDLAQCAHIIKDKPENFLVISGNDDLALPFMALGGDGVISVLSNAFPREFSQMLRWCLQGEFVLARDIHWHLFDVMEGIYADGSPSGVKAVLHIKGLIQHHLRLPLVRVNRALFNALSDMLGGMKKIEHSSS